MPTTTPKQAPCGSWKSPISAQMLTAKSVRLAEPRFDPADNNSCYWLESRPQEKGRNCIVKRDSSGNTVDITPAPINVRSQAHEYGGGHYCVNAGIIYFVLADDQRIYSIDTSTNSAAKSASPLAITAEGPYRYADLSFDSIRGQLLAVREDHSTEPCDENQEERHQIVAISIEDGTTQILQQGCDFYSNPRLSPSGEQLSWLSWNHPHMPWDNSQVWCANINTDTQLSNIRKIAGGNSQAPESCFQPSWSPDGQLYWVSDKNNWWNLYRLNSNGDGTDNETECVFEMAAEFATPQWVFGMSCYGFIDADNLLCCYSQDGQWQLACIDFEQHTLNQLDTPYSDLSALIASNGRAAFLCASATTAQELLLIDGGHNTIVARSSASTLDSGYLAAPQAITYPTGNGSNNTDNNEQAHAFYYPPYNNDYQPMANEQPPLIVLAHGGPTGATESSLNLKIQYWSSRGFAVLDVNYRGSTGYGRVYRDKLKNNWGITDVEDVCAGADYLIQKGLADKDRVAIKGSSAGGYTVLAALTFSDTFKAGCSLYGIGDLQTLATDTHKFESRYLDALIGPWPETKDIYLDRSPINHIDKLNCPVIFFQGLDDKVVPPNQAEDMFGALIQKGIATAYVPFKGEGHGFRQAANIERALEGELDFYGKVFGFQPADDIKPVEIKNADSLTQKEAH